MILSAAELPLLSLGWVVLPFIERNLGIRLTNEQIRRLFEFYRVDERGRRVVRRAAVLRPKGVGKSPEGGYLAFAELCGPVVFAGFDPKTGRPKGAKHPSPIIDIAAVAEDQTGNVMQWLYDVLVDRPKTCAELGLDIGMTRIRRRSSRTKVGSPGEIRVVSSAADSKEGTRSTFVVIDQSESLTMENGGVRLVGTLRRNVGKRGGWSVELMNAPEEGDGSVADRTIQAAAKGSEGIFFDRGPECPDVPDLADVEVLTAALRVVYGEAALVHDGDGNVVSGWVDVERLAAEINDPDTDPTDARRFYLNQSVPKGTRAFDRRALIAGSKVRSRIEKGAFVAAGFDGSLFHDATALVLCEISSGTMSLGGIWEKPDGSGDEWTVPVEEVDARVAELFDEFEFALLLADPFRWGTSIASWNDLQRKPWAMSFDTSKWKQIGHACRSFGSELRSGEVGLAPDEPELLLHLGHAVRREIAATDEGGRRLWTIRKPAPKLKIDAAMAAVLAAEARRRAIAGKMKPRRRVRAAGF